MSPAPLSDRTERRLLAARAALDEILSTEHMVRASTQLGPRTRALLLALLNRRYLKAARAINRLTGFTPDETRTS